LLMVFFFFFFFVLLNPSGGFALFLKRDQTC
jgi:hypothetical protein